MGSNEIAMVITVSVPKWDDDDDADVDGEHCKNGS